MTTKKIYLAKIYELLSDNGPMGVNAIAKHVDISVATVHRYLTNQSKIIQLENKKWAARPKLEELFDKEDQEILRNSSDDPDELMRLHSLLHKEVLRVQGELAHLQAQREYVFYYIRDALESRK